MNGETYQVFMAPSAHKKYKKFHSGLKEKIKQEVQKLAENPYDCEELKGNLKLDVQVFCCHSCESRNPLLPGFLTLGAMDSCFRRNDRRFIRISSKNLIIE